jgi:transposase
MHQYKPDEVLPPAVRISQGQFWTVSDLKVAVKQWYGVIYQSDTSYRELFKDGDFSVQRTTAPYRSRANQEEIADFEEQLEKK